MISNEELSDPKFFIPRTQSLIESTSGEDYKDCYPRNDDLSCMAMAIELAFLNLSATDMGTVVKESLVSAYLMGRRDATTVPEIFRNDSKGGS